MREEKPKHWITTFWSFFAYMNANKNIPNFKSKRIRLKLAGWLFKKAS